MFTRILTEKERRHMRAFIKADGEKATFMTVLATRCRKHVPQIRKDLALIEEFMTHYEPHVKKG
ncbi:hypothetical protein MUP05_03805 [Candidatus Bathyarchaeota archaeon]|nr:hypothetical protein [Candidatus Bathyarchaeota archaeon]